MTKNDVPNIIKKQTELALEYLNKAAPIISYKNLVPVSSAQIDAYVDATRQIIPDDFRYWLTKYGSGIIEFIECDIDNKYSKVPGIYFHSVYELYGDDGRLIDDEDPADCWKRIILGYGGSPICGALDTTIIDKNGCCPVIETGGYTNKVEKVEASSFPMWIISEVIDACKRLKKNPPETDYSNQMRSVVNEIAALNIDSIDKSLSNAKKKAMEHNKTCLADGEDPPDLIGDFVEKQMIENFNYPDDRNQILILPDLDIKINSLESAISIFDYLTSKGISSFMHFQGWNAQEFIKEKTKRKDIPGLKKLSEHPSYQYREPAIEALERLT